ncbi:MAG TPA: response regulator, partial [Roseiflexaceae bacterium]
MRILVVEDEQAIAAFVRQGLVEAGYAVDLAADGAEALHWAAIAEYDVIVLDVMLPDRDGLSICAEI